MFKTELELRALTPDLWALTAPLVWTQPGLTITVPRGFITDLASIPRVFWNLPFTDPNGVSRRPAALHDALYALGRSKGKAFADIMLRTALKSEGASDFVAGAFYKAVDLFGGGPYKADYHGDDTGNSSGDFVDAESLAAYRAAGATLFS